MLEVDSWVTELATEHVRREYNPQLYKPPPKWGVLI